MLRFSLNDLQFQKLRANNVFLLFQEWNKTLSCLVLALDGLYRCFMCLASSEAPLNPCPPPNKAVGFSHQSQHISTDCITNACLQHLINKGLWKISERMNTIVLPVGIWRIMSLWLSSIFSFLVLCCDYQCMEPDMGVPGGPRLGGSRA